MQRHSARLDNLERSWGSLQPPIINAPESMDMGESEGSWTDPKCWQQLLIRARNHGGSDAVWALFKTIRDKKLNQVFAQPHANELCDIILAAAVQDDSRIAALLALAHELYSNGGFRWPHIYVRIIIHCLTNGRYEAAARWHLQLTPVFSPSLQSYGAMFSAFVVDNEPRIQQTLITLYICSADKVLYDYIVPALFESGQSILARSWRKRLALFEDFPTSYRARTFLRFLSLYYPATALSAKERLIAESQDGSAMAGLDHAKTTLSTAQVCHLSDKYSDTIVAKWLASSWAPVNFAINCIYRLGLRVIGPRSLQSLALREPHASAVASRLMQLKRLGIAPSTQSYSRVLATFAKHNMQELLTDFLQSDIHPDEFDDKETRKMLMTDSIRQGDWRRERLMRGVEWALETQIPPSNLDSLLANELKKKRNVGKFSTILDRMDILQVSMSQTSAMLLLRRMFRNLGEHPRERTGDSSWILHRAISVTRRVTRHDVAIPVKYWKILVYNLGRLGRFEELYQLCMEVVWYYTRHSGGLIPVHQDDVPDLACADFSLDKGNRARQKEQTRDGTAESLTTGERDSTDFFNDAVLFEELFREKMSRVRADRDMSGYSSPQLSESGASHLEAGARHVIPTDLSLKHRQHPVQKLFDSRWQRSVVRWGYDMTLALRPSGLTMRRLHPSSDIRTYDVACGVRLLAILRDQGVLVDSQIIQSAIISRIALGQIPGRRRHRSRDEHETSLQHLKDLVDQAWGSEILPTLPELTLSLEGQNVKLGNRYPRLFQKAFQKTGPVSGNSTQSEK
ncbi:hypothetical protein CDD82_7954 [Ophiocordyceps australis]|uniref:Pentatricopeptide repeat domain-containing protein n=1 Tax=Ophiocordyceps australis TaxID=1399860 RepID=A0A2C5YN50_9HYPO|nr:hypothetical protein CDD82_7954 [Ophiocordyceps australis]